MHAPSLFKEVGHRNYYRSAYPAERAHHIDHKTMPLAEKMQARSVLEEVEKAYERAVPVALAEWAGWQDALVVQRPESAVLFVLVRWRVPALIG